MICTNLRITAPITTFLAFPRAAKRSAYALQPGHLRIAVIAGQYNAALSPTFPIFDILGRRRTDVPDSKWLGVTPTSAAAALADSYRSMSPNSASNLAAVISQMPTIEVSNSRFVRNSSCAARCSLIARSTASSCLVTTSATASSEALTMVSVVSRRRFCC